MKRLGDYQASDVIGYLIIAVVAWRSMLFYPGQTNQIIVILLVIVYGVFFSLESWLSRRYPWAVWLYFPLQTGLVVLFTSLRPFLDIPTLLYIPLGIQALRAFPPLVARVWVCLYIFLIGATLMLGLGWAEGLALLLLDLAVSGFLVSYDLLYSRTQADQAESQRLLTDLQAAHRKLQDYAAQAEELVAIHERNRLARDLHDSVSQVIFSIRLTSQSARLLLSRNPARVPEQIDRLQSMSEDALAQLRSLIADLRPPQDS